jgi:hypothetical protein
VIDIEAIVTAYLTPEVADLAVVVGNTPEDIDQPWVRVRHIGTAAAGNRDADYFHSFHIQFDCYAGTPGPEGQGEASTLYRAVRTTLALMPEEVDEVTAVRFVNALRLPDDALKPSRQRYILDARVYAK